jgi:flagellar motor switch protein FliM
MSRTDAAPIAPYDFKSPKRASRQLRRALQNLHEGFAKSFAAGLGTLVRGEVQVKLAGVEQVRLGEFLAGLDNPTCLNLLKAEPLPGNLLLEIQPSILCPILDRMLGGGSSGPSVRRPLTEIELRLTGRITNLLCAELRRAWASVLDLQCELVRVESSGRALQADAPQEAVVRIRFDVTFGDRRGRMHLCLPNKAIEPLADKLAVGLPAEGVWDRLPERPGGCFAQTVPDTLFDSDSARQIGRAVCGSRAEVKVCLAETRITTSELIGLRVGDIITTRKDVGSPLVVSVQGVPKFHARPGALKGRKAILITEPLPSAAPSE